MYSTFLERVFGYSPAAPPNNSFAASNSEGDCGPSGSAAPRLSTNDSTQYRATTRPYHCSQNQSSGAKGTGTGKGEADGFFSLAQEPGKSPKLVISVPRGSAESSTPLTAPSNGFHHGKRLPRPSSASSAGLDAMMMVSPTSSIATNSTATTSTAASSADHVRRFEGALRADPVDVAKLRELSWQGCPVHLRYEVWMFLTGSWSPQAATRMPTVSRRRMEYAAYIHSSYGIVDWDAVCAMVDSGVDTAVRRSTLKAVEAVVATPGASFASLHPTPSGSGVVAGELPPPELVITSASEIGTSLQASPLTPALAAEKGSGQTAAPGDGLAAHSSPRGLLRSSVSMEDVRSLLTHQQQQQQQHGNGANPPSPSLDSFSPVAEASFNSASHLVASPMQVAACDSRVFSTPTRSSPLTTSTATNAATTSHQLSASTMLGSKELQTLKQIRKDIPRMSGGRCYLRHPRVQGSIERILFIWSLRHPACGYVQGMNDLVVPFMAVVLAHHFCPTRSITELQSYTEDIFDEIWLSTAVPVAQWINEIEAEVYWLTSYVLNTMQDNYTSSHEGITAMMRHLAAVVQAADPPLYHSMVDTLQLQFEHFSFRWMNCLLLRELTETQSLRLLDAYLSDEERRWSVTHVYVCAALLLRWSPQLLSFGEDYISALKFLQSPPTEQMSLRDFQDVLSESFVLQNLYEASLSRLVARSK